MSVRTVDLYFLEEGKFRIKLAFNKLNDLLRCATLLVEELIAGKSEQFEAFILEVVVHLGQQLVVGRGESALTSHIDY